LFLTFSSATIERKFRGWKRFRTSFTVFNELYKQSIQFFFVIFVYKYKKRHSVIGTKVVATGAAANASLTLKYA